GTPADGWLRRAESAGASLRGLASVPGDLRVREQIGDIDSQAAAAVVDLRRFARQITAVERAAAGIGVYRLRTERATLVNGLLHLPDGPLRQERQRAVTAVDDQLAVYERLRVAIDTMLAKMQSTVLGLESLAARLAEVTALYATTGGVSAVTATRIAGLADDLDGMRTGLAEAERLSRQALGTPEP
ncbi:MAG: hypothetical protein HKP61_00255, partial [Dactylosporangium sp.]|nr:hypothetical protein [Dactylosporangium sp.]NNJ59404.1 hypothetical protein [Dactylosporangium sp.]